MNQIRILNLPVDSVTMQSALEFVDEHVRNRTAPAYIVCANPEKVYQLRRVLRLRSFFEAAELVIPDGIGIVVAARFLYGRRLTRVPGADLMQAICAVSPARNYRIFIYGASQRTNREAVGKLRARYPGIDIVGSQHGYLPADEMDGLISRINRAQPDILFVALGSPRQEIWIQQYLPRLNVKIVQGIGGTLDTITGAVRRAPRWMQAAGVEWLYRLLQQPSRAHRQLCLLRFAAEVLRTKLTGEPIWTAVLDRPDSASPIARSTGP
jgi:N-acetylglucosaminyldiphosphoundecaprenol N-acetyl-beta-D-mannosaminyltransferase